MAEGVRVHITDAAIIAACNTSGGPVHRWADVRMRLVAAEAHARAKPNDPLNAAHRGGIVGVYKASWATNLHTAGHKVGWSVFNLAPHAVYAEEGRGPSFKRQTFSWRGFTPPGATRTVSHTRGHDGQHALRDATNAIGERSGDWGPLKG